MKDLDALFWFIEVAKRGSFSEAARQRNQSTTTISRKIQLLELELNTKLFHRTTRSLSITEMGERLLPKAKLIIETSREMKNEIETYADRPSGRLHISSSSTVLEQVAPLLADFLRENSNITFHLESVSRYVDLAKQGVDFAFRLGPLADSSLISIPIAPLRYVLVGEKNFVKGRQLLEHPNQLIHWPCIRSHIQGLLYPWNFERNSEHVSFDGDNCILSNDLRVCKQMALKGTGLAYLPLRLVKTHIEAGTLVTLLTDWMPVDRDLYLVYTNRKHLPAKSKTFIQFIRDNRDKIDAAVNIG